MSLELFGGHVLQRADQHALRSGRLRHRRQRRQGCRGAAGLLREPEIQQLREPAVSMTLPGLRSRWTMPCLWAASSASAISLAMRSASASLSPALSLVSRSASV
ncbi:MAG TPA: hypothetical protein VD833_21985 [Vicinamibacterales bacterium]|nr:hypothetical protein [Vicinamibacterales bacterium]